MSNEKKRGRKPGVRNGEAETCDYWKEVTAKQGRGSLEMLCARAGVPVSIQHYRRKIPAAAQLYLSIMDEKGLDVAGMKELGHDTVPKAVEYLLKIRAL